MTITVDILPKLHTRFLLRILRKSCVTEQQLQKINDDREKLGLMPIENFFSKERYYETACVEPRAMGYEDYVSVHITIKQLKDELAKRKHVPNKQEGSAQRKEKARQGSRRGKRDR